MIALFLPDLRAGGAEKVMLSLGIFFHAQNIPICFVVGKANGPLHSQLPEHVPVFELGKTNAPAMVKPFIRFVNKEKPSVVFATLGAAITASIAKPFIGKNTRVIARLGNTVSAEAQSLSILSTLKYRLAAKVVSTYADVQVFQSQYMKKDYEAFLGKPVKNGVVIYNPLHADSIQNKSNEVVTSYDFVAVGRFMAQKNYPYLLEITEKMPACTFAILGDGILRPSIEQMILEKGLSKRVHVLGHTPNPYPYMKSASFVLSTSLYEGFSNVIIEALALGTPVIATDCPSGNREVLHDGNGRLIPLHNAASAVSIMEKAMRDKETFHPQQISEEALTRFSMEEIAQQYLQVLCPNA